MLNVTPLAGCGVQKHFVSVPSGAIIHFRDEDAGINSWANMGSGGATYNATKAGTPAFGRGIAGMNGLSFNDNAVDYFTLASEYVLPSASMIGLVMAVKDPGSGVPASDYFVGIGQHSSTNGGFSYFGGWVDHYAADLHMQLGGDKGGHADAASADIASNTLFIARMIVVRTDATHATFYFNGTHYADVSGTLSGTVRLGRLASSYGRSSSMNASGMTLHEAIVYPDLSVSWSDLDNYLKSKFWMSS